MEPVVIKIDIKKRYEEIEKDLLSSFLGLGFVGIKASHIVVQIPISFGT